MRSKQEVIKAVYGVEDMREARAIRWEDRLGADLQPTDQCVKFKLPYKAPGSPDTPSIAEIEKAMEENRLSPRGLRDVCRIGNSVVKRSGRAILQEAENMLFLQEHTRVRTPKVYDVFTANLIVRSKTYLAHYLVMEYLEGITLDDYKVEAMDEEAQKLIAASLAEQLQLLRSIPAPPEGYFGRVFRQGWMPDMLFLSMREREMCGPYDTYGDFISAMYANAELTLCMATFAPEWRSDELEFFSNFKLILGGTKEHRPVLTHMDVKFQNMIARPIKGEDGKIKDWEVTLIDWDTLGWLPGWAQYAALQTRMEAPMVLEQVFAAMEDSGLYSKEVEFLKKAMSVDYAMIE